MITTPHHSLPDTYVTTPLYAGFGLDVAMAKSCKHEWPDDVESLEKGEKDETGVLIAFQKCLHCCATRTIFRTNDL
jgi:hypothetical protein